MNETVVRWLESPEGEKWSRSSHDRIHGTLVMVKEDFYNEDDGIELVYEMSAFLWYARHA